jgi:hypothetical protein
MVNYALLVGCNYFGGNSLQGCINDVWLIRQVLLNKNYRVIMMTDHFRSLTSIRNIRNVDSLVNKTYFPFASFFNWILAYLSQNLKTTDSLFVHFSGHGSQYYTNNSMESDNLEEALVLYHNRSSLSLYLDNNIFTHFNNMKCKVFSLFDCCHSASIVDLSTIYTMNMITQDVNGTENQSGKQMTPRTKIVKRGLDAKTARVASKNVFLGKNVNNKNSINNIRIKNISGCGDDTYSYDVYIPAVRKFHGAFTYSFCSEIAKSFNTIQEFVDAVTMTVIKINGHLNQIPAYSYTDADNSYIIF